MPKNKIPKQKRYAVGKAKTREKMKLGMQKRKSWEQSEYFTRQENITKGTNKQRFEERKEARAKLRAMVS